MKKILLLTFIALLVYQGSSFAQAVDDRAVVPIAVTLNSILRLNVKSGGNIEFNFNNLEQYENGISNSTEYDTKITIASSTNWRLSMYAEDQALVSSDSSNASTSLALDYIGYSVGHDGADASVFNITPDYSGPTWDALTATSPNYIIQSAGTGNAGGVENNNFTIHWSCGDPGQGAASTMLGAGATGGRYATNVFFVLSKE